MGRALEDLSQDAFDVICELLDSYTIAQLLLIGSNGIFTRVCLGVRSFRIDTGQFHQRKFPTIVHRFVRLHALTLGTQSPTPQRNMILNIDWYAIPPSIRTLELYIANVWLSLYKYESQRTTQRMRNLDMLFPHLTTLRIGSVARDWDLSLLSLEKPYLFHRGLSTLHVASGLSLSEINALPPTITDLSFRIMPLLRSLLLKGARLGPNPAEIEAELWRKQGSFPPSLLCLKIVALPPTFPMNILPDSVTDLELSPVYGQPISTSTRTWPPHLTRLCLFGASSGFLHSDISKLPISLHTLDLDIGAPRLNGTEQWPPALHTLHWNLAELGLKDWNWLSRLPSSLKRISYATIPNPQFWRLLPFQASLFCHPVNMFNWTILESHEGILTLLPSDMTIITTRIFSPTFSRFTALTTLYTDMSVPPTPPMWACTFPFLTQLNIVNASRWTGDVFEFCHPGQLRRLSLNGINPMQFSFDQPWSSRLEVLAITAGGPEGGQWYPSPKTVRTLPESLLRKHNGTGNTAPIQPTQTQSWIAALPKSLRILHLLGGVLATFSEPLEHLSGDWPPLLETLVVKESLPTAFWAKLPISLSHFSSTLLQTDITVAALSRALATLPRNIQTLYLDCKSDGAQKLSLTKYGPLAAQLFPRLIEFHLVGTNMITNQVPEDQLLRWSMSIPPREIEPEPKPSPSNTVIIID